MILIREFEGHLWKTVGIHMFPICGFTLSPGRLLEDDIQELYLCLRIRFWKVTF